MSKTRDTHRWGRQTRRRFLKQAAGLGAGAIAVPCLVPASALGADGNVAANDRIGVGMIGTGNQGTGDMGAFLGDNRVQVVAVCDVNRESPGYWGGSVRGREPARQRVEQRYADEEIVDWVEHAWIWNEILQASTLGLNSPERHRPVIDDWSSRASQCQHIFRCLKNRSLSSARVNTQTTSRSS